MYHWNKSCLCCCMHCAINTLLLLLLFCLANANGSAPKYQTAYACEGKKLTIECEPGDLINLIRANYGRFSITICNDHGNVDWSVNCMFPRSLSVLASRCAHRQSCTVLATTSMFGDPCPGTHKYLEAHYVCISASQTTTTTTLRPSPPWLKTPIVPPLLNGSVFAHPAPRPPVLPSFPPPPLHQQHTVLPPRPPAPVPDISSTLPNLVSAQIAGSHSTTTAMPTATAAYNRTSTEQTWVSPINTQILHGDGAVAATGSVVGTSVTYMLPNATIATTTTSSVSTTTEPYSGSVTRMLSNNNNNMQNVAGGREVAANDASAAAETNFYCGPTNARNLFWNTTRVGEVNVQPCPGGASGIAKWRCVLMKRASDAADEIEEQEESDAHTVNSADKSNDCENNNHSNCSVNISTLASRLSHRLRSYGPTWHPATPDLTQCRSLWLNNLEVSVNQRESSLISIANDLSEVTSSKTLYGGDMLVTTKIIQTMSEKMSHDKETFPDQRQREAVIMELLHCVVKTGSNLLDESQLESWLDLNQEDQMRVATSLLTGLEYSAFLLADTITKERNVVQKVKNILLTVRVLETKNVQAFEVFPEADQWTISDDRIEIPRAALVGNSESGLVRVVFATFDRLESILKPTYDHFDDKSARNYVRNSVIISNETEVDAQTNRMRILNSKVISASLGKGRHTQLSQPIKLVLRHLRKENVTNPTCVFWNYIDHAWSANGCNLETTNRTHSICMCNHLTNFAILMDVIDDRGHSLFGMFDGNMRIMIYISVAICLVFILIALMTLKFFNGDVFMKSARTAIYRSIYVCLLFTEILFIIGIELTESSIFCCFTTVLLHCSILAGIAWFCFEAYQSYTTLTTDDMLLEVDQSAKVHCYYLLSYGLSLTIVAISSLINPSAYTKNDFCVLMEANTLFYVTFAAPVLIFLLCAFIYTFLSWIIMCRKSRTTLKNKEHTRLANVRFDIRCYFIFLLLLVGVWSSAYSYLRRAKLDDDATSTYGYIFVAFNSLLGLYMFIFHCIQDEKIRREYTKYVRNNSWLPRCLRCSKNSISSSLGAAAAGANTPVAAGTLTSNSVSVSGNHVYNGAQTQLKTKISPNEETGDILSAADIAATEDAIMSSSDCELNEAQVRRTAAGTLGTAGSITPITSEPKALQSGILPGNLMLQQTTPTNMVAECGTSGSGSAATTGTLRSLGGMVGMGNAATVMGNARTPSIGHASPTSSVSSSQLIFAHAHKAAPQQHQMPPEGFYHQPDFYNWKQGNKHVRQNGLSPQHYPTTPQTHEFFYWTQKHNQHGKKKRGGGNNAGQMPDSPSGSLHSRTTAAGSQILFYPSYKKTTLKQQQQQHQHQQQHPAHAQYAYGHYPEAIEPYYQQQQQHQQQHQRHLQQQQQYYQQQQQQQQQSGQMSSDDEHVESHAQLLHLNRRGMPHAQQQQQQHQLPPHHYQHHAFATSDFAPEQRYFRNKHSNCDLSQQQQLTPLEYDCSGGGGGIIGRGANDFYNHGSTGSDAGGPVYEEILSNRSSDVQHYDVGLHEQHHIEDMGRRVSSKRTNRRRRRRRAHVENEPDERGMESESACDDMNGEVDEHHEDVAELDATIVADNDDELRHAAGLNDLARADERMRRLMEIEDENFRRRFQRQQRKNTANDALKAPYHDFNGPITPHFSGGGGGPGSVRSYKKTSPNGRLAINELFNHAAPPLPPANPFPPIQKRQAPQKQLQTTQQAQQQQLSPINGMISGVPGVATSGAQPQQPVGRNISAMLDDNNTVRCYLEPLNNK